MLERLFSLLHEDLNSSWGEESNGASHVKQLEYKLYHYQNRRLCLNENCEDERLARRRQVADIWRISTPPSSEDGRIGINEDGAHFALLWLCLAVFQGLISHDLSTTFHS